MYDLIFFQRHVRKDNNAIAFSSTSLKKLKTKTSPVANPVSVRVAQDLEKTNRMSPQDKSNK